MQALEFIKANKIAVAIAVVIIVILVYVFYIKPKNSSGTSTTKDKFTPSSGKQKKKPLPKLGKGKKTGNKRNSQPVDDQYQDDPAEESDDDEVTAVAKDLHNIVHDDFAKENISLDEFKNATDNKISDAVYAELYQLYNESQSTGDPFKLTYRDYLPIIREHVAK